MQLSSCRQLQGVGVRVQHARGAIRCTKSGVLLRLRAGVKVVVSELHFGYVSSDSADGAGNKLVCQLQQTNTSG